jgi:CMP-N,N'-diacetyllegionaminic acid synthase
MLQSLLKVQTGSKVTKVPKVPKIHCLIPARKGSKSIPDKNIRLLNGKPLIAYSIELALQCHYVEKVVVSTDSEEYKKIAIEYGAEVPFLRPQEIAQDLSTDWEFMEHYLGWLDKSGQEKPELILHLRATFPKRELKELNEFVGNFLGVLGKYDSSRSVILMEKSPYKMYRIIEESDSNILRPLYDEVDGIKEVYNSPRQILPKVYLHNGCYDIVKTATILNGSVSGSKILPYVMKETEDVDIDEPKDWVKAEVRLK